MLSGKCRWLVLLLCSAGWPAQAAQTPLTAETATDKLSLCGAYSTAAEVEVWLEAGAAVNAVDRGGSTPLLQACREGNLEVARLLLAHGASVTAADSAGDHALNIAAGRKNLELVRLLLAAGADLEAPGGSDSTPLLNATSCSAGPAMVELLLTAGASIEVADSYGLTPLHYATLTCCKPGQENVAEALLLLSAGADPNVGAGRTETPLHLAARHDTDQLRDVLLAWGADVNATNGYGNTPLHYAGKYGCPAAGRWLVAHGARMDDVYATTAVDAADRLNELIAAGTRIDYVDWEGESPFQWAVRCNSLRVVARLLELPELSGVGPADVQLAILRAATRGQLELLRLLLPYSPPVYCVETDGSTAMHALARNDNAAGLELLSAAGYPLDPRNKDGHNPLHIAAAWGKLAALRQLLSLGADTAWANNAGNSSAHVAALCAQPAALQVLLQAGADPLALNCESSTLLHLACSGGYDSSPPAQKQARHDVVTLLLAIGLDRNLRDAEGHSPYDYSLPRAWCGTGWDREFSDWLASQSFQPGAGWQDDWFGDWDGSIDTGLPPPPRQEPPAGVR